VVEVAGLQYVIVNINITGEIGFYLRHIIQEGSDDKFSFNPPLHIDHTDLEGVIHRCDLDHTVFFNGK
jgi:hypothetical protein